jgi:excinuclease ABC subunit B
MQRALSEVKRRRKYQLSMNKKYGIKPRSIKKPIREKLIERYEEPIVESLLAGHAEVFSRLPDIDSQGLTPLDKKKLSGKLRREMLLAAQDLNFELAAEIRDKIRELST